MNRVLVYIGLVILTLGVSSLPGKKLLSLTESAWPFQIIVEKDQVYVADNRPMIHYYSLKGSKPAKQLVRAGEGPGEAIFPSDIALFPDYIFAYQTNWKVMYFSRKGDFLKEFRVGRFRRICPVGNNFMAIKTVAGQKTGSTGYEYSIYSYENKEMKYKKLVYYYELPPQAKKGNKPDYKVIHDDVFHIIYDNKVFIADSKRGLFVDIFDSNGKDFGRVHIYDFEPVKVSEESKKKFFEYIDSSSGDDEITSMYNYVFPEYYPAFYRFAVDKNKLYFLTYLKKDNKREVIIADWKGKFLKRTWVPWVENAVFFNFSIWNNKFYYVIENEEADEWELHVEDIK